MSNTFIPKKFISRAVDFANPGAKRKWIFDFLTYVDSIADYINNGIAPTASVASASVITPSGVKFHVTGTAAISTIQLPQSSFAGEIIIIPDGAWTLTTTGNIGKASTAVSGQAMILTYDLNTSKWYPSY